MEDMSFHPCSFLALLVVCLLIIIILLIQNYVDEKRLMATPSIKKDEAVMTAYANIKINASPAEVFNAITSFEKYGSGHSQYKWEDSMGTIPSVGATGMYSVRNLPSFE